MGGGKGSVYGKGQSGQAVNSGKYNAAGNCNVPDASDEEEHEKDTEEDGGDARWFDSEADEDDEDIADEVRSPFGPEVFPDAPACWTHAEEAHGFSLARLKAGFGAGGWTDYHRIRLVNFLRHLGCEEARRQAPDLTASHRLWQEDVWLAPVFEDDALLFQDDDDAEAAEKPATGAVADGVSVAASSARKADDGDAARAAGEAEDDEVGRLRQEVAQLRRLLSEEDAASGPIAAAAARGSGGEGGEDDEPAEAAAEASRALALDGGPAGAAAFRWHFLRHPAMVEGRTALNVGCGAGVLSCLCARLGAKVVAVDASRSALEVAHALAAANGLRRGEVALFRGDDLRGHGRGQPAEEDAGGLACDLIFSERLAADLRYSAALLDFLAARRRHLRPGGTVWPARVALKLRAVDFSEDAAAWRKPRAELDNLDLSTLAHTAVRTLPSERIASCVCGEAVELLVIDLTTATSEDALLHEARFRLELRPGCRLTGLALSLEALVPQLGNDKDEQGLHAKEAPALIGDDADLGPRWVTILHLPAPVPAGAGPLVPPSAAFPAVEGCMSTTRAPGGRLELALELRAPGGALGGAGRESGSEPGRGPAVRGAGELRTCAGFVLV